MGEIPRFLEDVPAQLGTIKELSDTMQEVIGELDELHKKEHALDTKLSSDLLPADLAVCKIDLENIRTEIEILQGKKTAVAHAIATRISRNSDNH